MQTLSWLKFMRFLVSFLAFYMVAIPVFSKGADNTKPSTATQSVRILVVGDSLSAEYGLKRGTGWVALLENRLAESVNWNEKPRKTSASKSKINTNTKITTNNVATEEINTPATAKFSSNIAPDFTVINASISGDTTSGGRSRLGALLETHRPTHVVIELGANDALRGLSVPKTEENLNAMVQMALKAKAKVLLVGIQIPPNYGAAFAKQFAATFPKVAKANKVGLVPFMLAGVADSPDYAKLFQPDRIHPTEAAHPIILDNIWPELQKLLKTSKNTKTVNVSK